MPRSTELVRRYIRAKDDNRPFLMKRVFAPDGALKMVNQTSALDFPAMTRGEMAITETFIRRFAQKYENVYTFCLGNPPAAGSTSYSCDWLLGMSEKDGGALRSGCGRYDWIFEPGDEGLVSQLTITIELMPPVPADHLEPLLSWLAALPYPWCGYEDALSTLPKMPALDSIREHLLARREACGGTTSAA